MPIQDDDEDTLLTNITDMHPSLSKMINDPEADDDVNIMNMGSFNKTLKGSDIKAMTLKGVDNNDDSNNDDLLNSDSVSEEEDDCIVSDRKLD